MAYAFASTYYLTVHQYLFIPFKRPGGSFLQAYTCPVIILFYLCLHACSMLLHCHLSLATVLFSCSHVCQIRMKTSQSIVFFYDMSISWRFVFWPNLSLINLYSITWYQSHCLYLWISTSHGYILWYYVVLFKAYYAAIWAAY